MGAKGVLIFAIGALDAGSFDKDAILLRDAEVAGDVLQAEVFELSRGDIVILRENPSIHDMPATGDKFWILDHFFRDLKARRA